MKRDRFNVEWWVWLIILTILGLFVGAFKGYTSEKQVPMEPPVVFGFRFGATLDEIKREYQKRGEGYCMPDSPFNSFFTEFFGAPQISQGPWGLLKHVEYSEPLVPVEDAGPTTLLFYKDKLAKVIIHFKLDFGTFSNLLFLQDSEGEMKYSGDVCYAHYPEYKEAYHKLEKKYENIKSIIIEKYGRPKIEDKQIEEIDWNGFEKAGQPWEDFFDFFIEKGKYCVWENKKNMNISLKMLYSRKSIYPFPKFDLFVIYEYIPLFSEYLKEYESIKKSAF